MALPGAKSADSDRMLSVCVSVSCGRGSVPVPD